MAPSQKPNLKIGLLSPHNAYDRNAFSGTVFYMRKALESLGEVRVLGGHLPVSTTLLGKLKSKLFAAKPMRMVEADQGDLDVIVAPVASSTINQFATVCSVPLISITDATPGFLQDFYGQHISDAHRDLEREMITNVQAIVYSSQYMADRAAIEFPEVLGQKARVVPFGVNLDKLPETVAEKPSLDRLELLFIGQDWERKGGDIALETVDVLNARGVSAHLTTIGASNAEGHQSVTSLGYLNKNLPEDMIKFEAALRNAHFLLLPSRADCTPMVIAEANAYGCPVIATDTGGIGSLLHNQVNGQMLPVEVGGESYADVVEDMSKDAAQYRALSHSSFAFCDAHLTWSAWSIAMKQVIESVLFEEQKRPER